MKPVEDGSGRETFKSFRLYDRIVLDSLDHRLAYAISQAAVPLLSDYDESLLGKLVDLLLVAEESDLADVLQRDHRLASDLCG